MPKRKVLITGLSGLIGSVIRPRLERRYEFIALNRRDVPGVLCHQADIGDFDAIRPAFHGKEVVVHLAATTDDRKWCDILRSNLIGCHNVFEAARLAGVKRIIFASSGAVTQNYEKMFPWKSLVGGRYDEVPRPWPMITHESPIRPRGLYGCSKAWGEALGRLYSDEYGISVICLRIGPVNSEDRPRDRWEFSTWCSHRDMAQMVERCIEAPESLRFDIFYVTSNNKWGYRDISHARAVLGYEPQDSAESYR